jgi:hypothetical protein
VSALAAIISTDGILETCNREDREFGIAGLEGCMRPDVKASLPQIAGKVLEAVSAWGKQKRPLDPAHCPLPC